jgi:osmotically-inducible protein OsmY
MRCRKRIIMRSDDDIKRDVEEVLVWDPALAGSAIGVAVLSGIVTLIGRAKSDVERILGERDAKRVLSVLACVNEVEVCWAPHDRLADTDIARSAVSVLEAALPYWPPEVVQLLVRNGWVTLEGEVGWHYQQTRAESTVRRMRCLAGNRNAELVGTLSVPKRAAASQGQPGQRAASVGCLA